MKKENFTAERVTGFTCKAGKSQSIYWDAKTPGLGLRATTGGAKSYIFESKLHGKTIRMTIGDIRTWPVGKAQKEATDLKTTVDKGIDPRKQRADQKAQAEAEQQAEERKDALFKDVWAAYMLAKKSKWSVRHYSDVSGQPIHL
jgi:hypothetical protein